MSEIVRIEVTLQRGDEEPKVLGASMYLADDVLTGERMTFSRQAPLMAEAVDAAIAQVKKNITLWGCEGLLMEVDGRDPD